jgi:hypothetical protein
MRISRDLQMAVVGSPEYLATHPAPATPQDIAAHRGINLRMLSGGRPYPWWLEKDAVELRVRVAGQLALTTPHDHQGRI